MATTHVRCKVPTKHGVGFHVSGSKAARECLGASRDGSRTSSSIPAVRSSVTETPRRISARRVVKMSAFDDLAEPAISHETIGSSPALVVSMGPRNDLVFVRDPEHTFVTFRDDTDDWMQDYAESGLVGYDSADVRVDAGGRLVCNGGAFDWSLRKDTVPSRDGDVLITKEDVQESISMYRMSKSEVLEGTGMQPNWLYEDEEGNIREALMPALHRLQGNAAVVEWLRNT